MYYGPTPESWAKAGQVLKDARFYLKPTLEMFNIGGTYQVVPEKDEEFIREHERLHREWKGH